MGRRTNQPKLDTPTARKRLAARHAVYWNVITKGGQLGYRRATASKPGVWHAKYEPPKEVRTQDQSHRLQTTIGIADDFTSADGLTSFDYAQARQKVIEWFSAVAEQASGTKRRRKGYTVADACADYLVSQRKNSAHAYRTECAINAKIIPHLGDIIANKLTRAQIETWMMSLAENRRRKPSGGIAADSPESLRRAKDTTNRVLRILKAALTHALDADKLACSGKAWKVKQFRDVEQNRIRFLTDDEARALVEACPVPFRNLVRAALYSGARYGELLRLEVQDFDSLAKTLFVAQSKSGKPRTIRLDHEASQFFGDACKGRRTDELMFPPTGPGWCSMQVHRLMIDAAKDANIAPVTFHELRHTAASRWARQGLSLLEIAGQLGHSSTRKTEKYSHLCPDPLAAKIRGFKPMRIYSKARQRKPALTAAVAVTTAKPQTDRIQ